MHVGLLGKSPRKKVVAYARDLHHWAEQNNPPAGGGPRLLAESSTSILTSGGCWGIPLTIQGLEAKSGINSTPLVCTSKASSLPTEDPTPPKASLPVQALALIWPPTLPHGFAGVTACLWTPELVEVALEAPLGTMPIGLVATPRISTMSTNCIIKDDATGVRYMDTVTTSIGRMTLSGPDLDTSSLGPTIKDVTNHE